TGAAIGLNDIAVQMQRALPQRLQVEYGPQAAPDQTLDFLRTATLFAAGRFPVTACVGGTRQHAIFGGDPAPTLALEEGRYLVQHAGIAQHPGLAHGNQHRTFSITRISSVYHNRTELTRRTAGRALEGVGE